MPSYVEGPDINPMPDLPARPQAEPGIGQMLDPNMPVDPQERLRNAFAMMLMQQPGGQGQAMPMQELMAAQMQKQAPGNMDYFAVPGTGGKDVMATPMPDTPPPGINPEIRSAPNPSAPKTAIPPLDALGAMNAFPGAQSARIVPPGDKAYQLPGRPSLAERG